MAGDEKATMESHLDYVAQPNRNGKMLGRLTEASEPQEYSDGGGASRLQWAKDESWW